MKENQALRATPGHRRPNYGLVFLVLAVLTALEVGVTYIPGIPRAPFLLSMAFIKVMLVILYFMHLKSDSKWFSLVFLVPFLLIIPLLMVITQ
jgi:cytochrome c oxidase subunit IV